METLVQTVWASVVDEQVGRVAWFGHLVVVVFSQIDLDWACEK